MSTTASTIEIAAVCRRFYVVGMTCSHCERAVEAEVAALAGVVAVAADAATGTVTVESTHELAAAHVASAVDEAGYELAR
jgi:copper chaperone